jgi:hypothetical protein
MLIRPVKPATSVPNFNLVSYRSKFNLVLVLYANKNRENFNFSSHRSNVTPTIHEDGTEIVKCSQNGS